jgi:hypothetical protein
MSTSKGTLMAKRRAVKKTESESLEVYRRDLRLLAKQPKSTLRRLAQIAEAPEIDREQLVASLATLPDAAQTALSFALGMSPEKAEEAASRLGTDGKTLRELRDQLMPLRSIIVEKEIHEIDRFNVWSRAAATISYDFNAEAPVIDLRLLDPSGKQIFRSKSDVGDFLELARVCLEYSVSCLTKVRAANLTSKGGARLRRSFTQANIAMSQLSILIDHEAQTGTSGNS